MNCADPGAIEGLQWLICYLTTGKHIAFYFSFLVVIALILLAAPLAMCLGFAGALAKRAGFAPLRWLGQIYTSMVRGVPDILFFLFVPIAMDQGLEWLRHKRKCPDWEEPVRQGSDFVVCAEAKLPLSSADAWVHETYGFLLALVAFGLVFGAFCANVIDGALRSVPKGQIEAASAVGMSRWQMFRRVQVPQMWIYALPGLSNLWQILIKATPLLFLLGVEDIVYWARELGGMKTSAYAYPHPDWRVWYFLGLLVFYLFLTWVSQSAFDRLSRRLSRGQALAGSA